MLTIKRGAWWIIVELFGWRIIFSTHLTAWQRPLEFEIVTNYAPGGAWSDQFLFFGPFNFAVGRFYQYKTRIAK